MTKEYWHNQNYLGQQNTPIAQHRELRGFGKLPLVHGAHQIFHYIKGSDLQDRSAGLYTHTVYLSNTQKNKTLQSSQLDPLLLIFLSHSKKLYILLSPATIYIHMRKGEKLT